MTGKVPFYDRGANEIAVMFAVIQGIRPSRPAECSGTPALDNLWELIQECWRKESDARLKADQIVERLVGPLIQATTTRSTSDWDDTFTSKFRRSMQVQCLLPSVAQIERMIFGDG
jgi:hypothetical protein